MILASSSEFELHIFIYVTMIDVYLSFIIFQTLMNAMIVIHVWVMILMPIAVLCGILVMPNVRILSEVIHATQIKQVRHANCLPGIPLLRAIIKVGFTLSSSLYSPVRTISQKINCV